MQQKRQLQLKDKYQQASKQARQQPAQQLPSSIVGFTPTLFHPSGLAAPQHFFVPSPQYFYQPKAEINMAEMPETSVTDEEYTISVNFV